MDRYGPRIEDYRLPESKEERVSHATLIGADGLRLLRALDAPDAPPWLRDIPALQTLRRVWIQNYTWTASATLRWRTNEEIPPAGQFIGSPYDVQARYSQKRSTSWVGYKIHLTESCAADRPHLITNVETTPATTSDDAVTATIHESLQARELLPSGHFADTGFIDAELLVESTQRYQVDLFGPVRGTIIARHAKGRGLPARIFRSIGTRSAPPAPPDAKAAVGLRPSISGLIR